MKKKTNNKYHKLRAIDVLNLAAPSTWAASILPSTLALVITYIKTGNIDIFMAVCLFIVALLMQSAVNTFDDYADFKKGTDTLDNSPDATDAVIVYGLSPTTARNVGIAFFILAGALGLYTVYLCGIELLIIGLIGAITVILYPMGKLPISYLPLGEFFSGFVMGGLITLAGVFMQTGEMDYMVLLYSLPIMLGISMTMFTNNSCDIERDTPAGRHTLSVLLGRKKTNITYKVALTLWLLMPISLLVFKGNYLIYIFELPVLLYGYMCQFKIVLSNEQRGLAMEGIHNLSIISGLAYMIALMM